MIKRKAYIKDLDELPKQMGYKVINGDETIDIIRTSDDKVLPLAAHVLLVFFHFLMVGYVMTR